MTTAAPLRAVTGYGLAGAAGTVGAVEDPGALLAAVAEHRLTGIAARALDAGDLELPSDAAAILRARHDVVMAQTLRVELALIEVAGLLADAGVDHRVLKGSALAHTVAMDPADREFRDVDVLVPASQIDRAVAALTGAGAMRLQPELRPGFDRRFAKSVTMRLDGVEVDIHRTLAPGPFGVWIHAGDLFVVGSSFTVADRQLATLDRTDHLVHACYHVALGQSMPAFTNLRDIALLASGPWDAERFDSTVTRWQGRPVVARAVRLVRELAELELPSALTEYRPSPGDAAMLAPYVREGDRFPALALATARALGPADRATYARAIALPAGAGVRQRVSELWSNRPHS